MGFDRRLRELEDYISLPARTLDFGCDIGSCVNAAQNRAWDAIGYDRSNWSTNLGLEALEVNIVSGAGPDSSPAEFNLIALRDCIEHLTDPRELLVRGESWL